jgi:acetyl-CoA carboxylase biotin carboxylase subunit
LPSPGTITYFHAPGGPGVRVDSHIYGSYKVPPFYDSLIAKIIVHGDTREQALARMRSALDETVIEGIRTNIPLHHDILRGTAFQKGQVNIHYLEKWMNM